MFELVETLLTAIEKDDEYTTYEEEDVYQDGDSFSSLVCTLSISIRLCCNGPY